MPHRLIQRGVLGALLFILGTSVALAERCSTPLDWPVTFHRSKWAEIEEFKPKVKNPDMSFNYQGIKETGIGKINLDYFAVRMNKGDLTTATVLADLRANLNEIVFSGVNLGIYPASPKERKRWNSSTPLGTIMIFDLARIKSVTLERGAVILSCLSEEDFIFSTIQLHLLPIGTHPVSGHRAFGVFQDSEETITIYVKAVDRVVRGYFAFGNFGGLTPNSLEVFRENVIFAGGEKVWKNLQNNLVKRYAKYNAKKLSPIARRVNY
ncbi:hypothetical protein [Pelagibius sp. Alg239-R121]|uniref:hypothetical protein n=1 Tax=Pelagibius sp. Alg239-R121 TaxID=2993448 RepID=UPI0024A73F05|nr:hypothetical protein [Pelagibius sp. Alg239-R121]